MGHKQKASGIAPEQLGLSLQNSPAYRSLSPAQQGELSRSMARVFDYLSQPPAGAQDVSAPARPFAPDLSALRPGGGGAGGGQQPAPGQYGQGQPAQGQAPAGDGAAGGQGGGQGAVDRVAGVAGNVIGAIDFPGFVASLIQGTFQAIVDASIQQMEAYSNLLRETAKTVDTFMDDNVTDDMARDHLADTYGDVFYRDLSSGRPKLQVDQNTVGSGELPSFLQNLGFDSPMDMDQRAVDEVVVPEAKRTLAEMRHQTLATMVMMGINRVVVVDGEINAKLIFHVAASEAMQFTFDESKPTSWTYAGTLGRDPFGASGVMVQTTSLNAQTDLNVRADLTGEVRVRFRSETFPLERFADSAAIQLINTRATVPQPRSEPATGTGTAAAGGTGAGNGGAAAGTDAVEQAVRSPHAVLPPAAPSGSQRPSIADPWLPRRS